MTLSALIRKRDTGNLATAIPAISATQPKGEAATVARIATVAIANPKEEKAALSPKVGAGDTAVTSWGWLVAYPDGRAFEAYIVPEQTLAEVRAIHPGAIITPIERIADFLQ